MKNLIKNIYILTLLFAFWFASYSFAASNISTKTDCYRKNNSYQCTTKSCKVSNLKSCTYKTIKTTPPNYKKVVVQNIITNKTINNTWFVSTGVVMITGSINTWSVTGVIVSGSVVSTGSTGNIIVPISNTKNTISGLSKFYDTISGAIIVNNSWARYSIVEFGDFECPYCQKFHNKKILETVMSKYPNNINYYFMNYPLTKIHQNAWYIAKWYVCSLEQDPKRATTYINFIYDQTIGDVVLLLNEWKKWLSITTFDTCMSNTWSDATIKYQMSIADKIGITGTPSVLMINNDTAEYEVIAWAYDTWAYNSVITNRQDQLSKFPYTAGK